MLGSERNVSKHEEPDNGNGSALPTPLNSADPLAAVIYDMAGDRKDRFSTFPGMDGVPHRATGVRYYKNKDPAHLQPNSAGRVHCEIFDISDPAQKERYELVSSLAYSMAKQGKAIVTSVDRQFNQQAGSWLIFLEWVELFTYDTMGARGQSVAEPGVLRRS